MATKLKPYLRHISNFPARAFQTAKYFSTDDAIILNWPKTGPAANNWGDKLNEYIARKIFKVHVFHRNEVYVSKREAVHFWIGSHLGSACLSSSAVVWGSGFISKNEKIHSRPREIRAVRGWKSHQRLIEAGIVAPNVVGDVALLMPRFYTPAETSKRFAIGVIPHFRDKNLEFFRRTTEWSDVLIIDIEDDVEVVIDQIVSCDRIISSSLHGIICADAYGVPANWIQCSNNLLGDGFKFLDYFSSVSRSVTSPLVVNDSSTRQYIEDSFRDYCVQIDLDKLMLAAPLNFPAS